MALIIHVQGLKSAMGRGEADAVVARDFLSTLSTIIPEEDDHVGKRSLCHLYSDCSPTNIDFLKRKAAAAEMKHKLAWIKATLQEQSPTNLPGSRALLRLPGIIHPMRMEGSDPVSSMKLHDSGSKTQEGTHIHSPSLVCVVCEGINAATSAQTSRTPPASGMKNVQCNRPLTIFYGGNVNVFDNISAVKAQEIMLLASGRPSILPANLAVEESKNTDFAAFNEASNMVVEHGNHHFMQFDIKNVTVANYGSSPNYIFSAAEPLVPTALPHARKASLARFLEKRRERVQSKCPYALEGGLFIA